jgi:hypothetical protein
MSGTGPFRIEGVPPGNYQIIAVSGSIRNPYRYPFSIRIQCSECDRSEGKNAGGCGNFFYLL